MASEQMPRREIREISNDVKERDDHVESDRKESLGDKGRDQREKERKLVSDRARSGNIVKDKELEEGRRGRESGGGGKFEKKGEEKKGLGENAKLQGRTRVVEGKEWNKYEKRRSNRPREKVEAEKARPMENKREEAQGREKDETEAQTKEDGGEEGGRARESGGGVHHAGKFETEGEKKRPVEKEELERRTREVEGGEWNKDNKQRNSPRGKVEAEKARPEDKGIEKDQTKEGGSEEQGRGREQKEQPSLEDISKYRAEAQQKAMNAIESAKEKYERERDKQAGIEAAKERNKQANEEGTQAKDLTREKGQEGNLEAEDKGQKAYGEAKDSTDIVDKTTPLDQKAKSAGIGTPTQDRSKQENEEAAQEKDVKGQEGNLKAEEKGQKGYGEAKDTTGTVDHTTPPDEKTKSGGGTNAQNVGEQAAQDKDVKVESGKSASLAADLRDKAIVTGWSVAHYSTEMTVEGTKAATNVVEEAVEYLGQKAYELASKSLDTATGLAAATGENAKEYTARKKEEAERILESKREAPNQESKERPSAKTTTESFQRGHGQEEGKLEEYWNTEETFEGGEREEKPFGSIIGETLGNAAETMKKPWDKATEGGRQVLGAVGETVMEIGENIVKPAQNVHQDQGEEGGVLNAIGETIAEIAETTRVMVAGEGEKEKTKSHEYEHADLKRD